MTASRETGPVQSGGRMHQLDVLRGLAILGILVVNVQQMFLPMAYANEPVAAMSGAWGSRLAWFVTDALFENKFITLFSLLFGAGFALQWSRSGPTHRGFTSRYLRRLFLLAVFGILHGAFFYGADVLAIYALTALALMPWKRRRPKTLAIAGSVLLALTIAWGALIGGPDEPATAQSLRDIAGKVAQVRETGVVALPEREYPLPRTIDVAEREGWEATGDGTLRVPAASYALPIPGDLAILILDGNEEELQALVEYAVYSSGPWGAAVFARVSFLTMLLLLYLPVYLGWRTLALFLIGAALVKSGALADAGGRFWSRATAIGLLTGLPITLAASLVRLKAFESQDSLVYLGNVLHDVSSLLLAAGVAGAIFRWARRGLESRLQRGLANVGRTALTNYIGQSVAMSLVATSYGLGLFSHLSRAQLFGLAFACFALQIVASSLWLRRFRMGPLEWVWRCFSYLKVQPLLRRRARGG